MSLCKYSEEILISIFYIFISLNVVNDWKQYSEWFDVFISSYDTLSTYMLVQKKYGSVRKKSEENTTLSKSFKEDHLSKFIEMKNH